MRATNGKISLRVPLPVIKASCAPYLVHGKPAHLSHLKDLSDHDIVDLFGAQYRGIVQYYLLASDVWRLDRLKRVMLTSMLKTLAARHRSTVTKMARKHMATIATPHGPRRCFEARTQRDGRKPLVARFGGIPLQHKPRSSHWRARRIERCTAGSGRGPLEKGLPSGHLASGLPELDHAQCVSVTVLLMYAAGMLRLEVRDQDAVNVPVLKSPEL